jgi:hypothetical protein
MPSRSIIGVGIIIIIVYQVLVGYQYTRVRKTRRNVKPVSVQRRNHLNSHYYNPVDNDSIIVTLHIIEKEGRESLEDVIVTDKNIKVVSQLPVNNKREISRLLPIVTIQSQSLI